MNIMLYAIPLGFIVGLLRAAHGSGYIKRWVEIAFATLFTVIFNLLTSWESLGVLLGLVIGLTPGWGKYFAATGLQPYNREEEEIGFIDIFTDDIKNDTLAGIAGMSLRWSIFFIPLFSMFHHIEYASVLLLIGPLYYLQKFHKKFIITEFFSGFILGVLLALLKA